MSHADLSWCDQLRQDAGWNQTLMDWERYLELSPQGCFVAINKGKLVGTVTTTAYGNAVGWIGMLLVGASARGQGIGTALLQRAIQHLKAEKIRCVKLDATPKGETLYRKIGFQPEWTLTRFERTRFDAREDVKSVRTLDRADLPQVIALDAEAFGVGRPELIRSLRGYASVAFVGEELGPSHGFAMLRSGSVAYYFGPIVAQSTEGAETLLRALIASAAPGRVYWDVPDLNQSAVGLARKYGFVPQRQLLRMFFGDDQREGNVSRYYGLADPSLG